MDGQGSQLAFGAAGVVMLTPKPISTQTLWAHQEATYDQQ
jgi:hypothetical protein